MPSLWSSAVAFSQQVTGELPPHWTKFASVANRLGQHCQPEAKAKTTFVITFLISSWWAFCTVRSYWRVYMLEPGCACAEQRNLLGSHCWRLIFSREAVWLFALASPSPGCRRSSPVGAVVQMMTTFLVIQRAALKTGCRTLDKWRSATNAVD